MSPPWMRLLPGLDKVGVIGAILSTAAAPCCFPLFASVGAALGLTFLKSYEQEVMYVIQGFVIVAFVGSGFAYRRHGRKAPLILAGVGVALVFAFYYGGAATIGFYAGLGGLALSGAWNLFLRTKIRYLSVITCPHCGFKKEERMPTEACQFFYECTSCHERLKPEPGDCCVFCSYGSVRCPPVQLGQGCCS